MWGVREEEVFWSGHFVLQTEECRGADGDPGVGGGGQELRLAQVEFGVPIRDLKEVVTRQDECWSLDFREEILAF